ncbi:MAG: glyoxylate/hydroxypyruvate reductase A [Rhodobacteraceae bacterium]|nr:glyoxylate/hydroxypyruvate reductase A [Paracoccaceae bacterium]
MAARILFSAHQRRHAEWLPQLRLALKSRGLDDEISTEVSDAQAIQYIIHSPDGSVSDFSRFESLRAVLSLWAGVEEIASNPTLRAPLIRMLDPGMIDGMVEWVTGQVLRHHLGMDAHIFNRSGQWLKHLAPPLARERVVGMLGLGSLGQACIRSLARFKFQLLGWSRTPKTIDGVTTHCGTQGLARVLGRADIVVILVPLTSDTENFLDGETLASAKPGLTIVNCGRGALIDDGALLDAIGSGRVGHATLDVFREEPLPPDHPFWVNEKISIWPHISSETRVDTASSVIACNLERLDAGLPVDGLVNFERGY